MQRRARCPDPTPGSRRDAGPSHVLPAPAGLWLLAALLLACAVARADDGSIDLDSLVRVDPAPIALSVGYDGYNRRAGEVSYRVTLANVSSDTLEGDLWVAVHGITSADVTFLGPDAVAADGTPLVRALAGDALGPGEAVSVLLRFSAPARSRFGFTASAHHRPLEPQPAAPAAPSDLGTSAPGAREVVLVWTDESGDEDRFVVERALAGTGGFAPVAEPPADATSFTDTTVEPGTAYDYRVRAGNGAGLSPPSNTSSVTTLAELDLVLTKTGPASFRPGERIGYSIEIRNDGPGDAENVTLDESIPQGTALVGVSVPCDVGGGGSLHCDLGTLAAGESVTIELPLEVEPGSTATEIINAANVISTGVDLHLADNSDAHTSIVLVAVPDLRGLPRAQAEAELAALGLGARIDDRELSQTVPIDGVLRASVAPGDEVPHGTTVGLVLSEGVPAVWGGVASSTPFGIPDWLLADWLDRYVEDGAPGDGEVRADILFLGATCYAGNFLDNLDQETGNIQGGATVDDVRFTNATSITANGPFQFCASGGAGKPMVGAAEPGATAGDVHAAGVEGAYEGPLTSGEHLAERPQIQGDPQRAIGGASSSHVLVWVGETPEETEAQDRSEVADVLGNWTGHPDTTIHLLVGTDEAAQSVVQGTPIIRRPATPETFEESIREIGALMDDGPAEQLIIVLLDHGTLWAVFVDPPAVAAADPDTDAAGEQRLEVAFADSVFDPFLREAQAGLAVTVTTGDGVDADRRAALAVSLNACGLGTLDDASATVVTLPDGTAGIEWRLPVDAARRNDCLAADTTPEGLVSQTITLRNVHATPFASLTAAVVLEDVPRGTPEGANEPPTLTLPDGTVITGRVGENLLVDPLATATDAEGDAVEIRALGLPASCAISPPARLECQPGAGDEGRHDLVVLAGETRPGGGAAYAFATLEVGPPIVADTPPDVFILAPVPGASIETGVAVTLAGQAFDAQDGDLGVTIVWQSDRDGPLGTGAVLDTVLTSPGPHVITASVRDAAGNEASAEVAVEAFARFAGDGATLTCRSPDPEACAPSLDGDGALRAGSCGDACTCTLADGREAMVGPGSTCSVGAHAQVPLACTGAQCTLAVFGASVRTLGGTAGIDGAGNAFCRGGPGACEVTLPPLEPAPCDSGGSCIHVLAQQPEDLEAYAQGNAARTVITRASGPLPPPESVATVEAAWEDTRRPLHAGIGSAPGNAISYWSGPAPGGDVRHLRVLLPGDEELEAVECSSGPATVSEDFFEPPSFAADGAWTAAVLHTPGATEHCLIVTDVADPAGVDHVHGDVTIACPGFSRPSDLALACDQPIDASAFGAAGFRAHGGAAVGASGAVAACTTGDYCAGFEDGSVLAYGPAALSVGERVYLPADGERCRADAGGRVTCEGCRPGGCARERDGPAGLEHATFPVDVPGTVLAPHTNSTLGDDPPLGEATLILRKVVDSAFGGHFSFGVVQESPGGGGDSGPADIEVRGGEAVSQIEVSFDVYDGQADLTVDELSDDFGAGGWRFDEVRCDDRGAGLATFDVSGGRVAIDAPPGALVVCEYHNVRDRTAGTHSVLRPAPGPVQAPVFVGEQLAPRVSLIPRDGLVGIAGNGGSAVVHVDSGDTVLALLDPLALPGAADTLGVRIIRAGEEDASFQVLQHGPGITVNDFSKDFGGLGFTQIGEFGKVIPRAAYVDGAASGDVLYTDHTNGTVLHVGPGGGGAVLGAPDLPGATGTAIDAFGVTDLGGSLESVLVLTFAADTAGQLWEYDVASGNATLRGEVGREATDLACVRLPFDENRSTCVTADGGSGTITLFDWTPGAGIDNQETIATVGEAFGTGIAACVASAESRKVFGIAASASGGATVAVRDITDDGLSNTIAHAEPLPAGCLDPSDAAVLARPGRDPVGVVVCRGSDNYWIANLALLSNHLSCRETP